MLDETQILSALQRIAPYVRETPVIRVEPDAFSVAVPVTLKLEYLQHTGSFKPRGAFNRILSSKVPGPGVIAASGGNHGLAVAYAARTLGHRAEIFVPTIAAPIKIERLRALGAEVHVVGARYADALAASEIRRQETGALTVHAYDQPEVLAGQGTAAVELSRQAADIDTVLVAVGGGGFIGGIAAYFRNQVRVVGVEPESSCALHQALHDGAPVDVDVSGIAADSLGARRVGELMFEIAQQYVPQVVLVSDDQIRQAQRMLWNELRIIAEPGGAAATAALLSGRYRAQRDERIAILVCGANCDPATIMT